MLDTVKHMAMIYKHCIDSHTGPPPLSFTGSASVNLSIWETLSEMYTCTLSLRGWIQKEPQLRGDGEAQCYS